MMRPALLLAIPALAAAAPLPKSVSITLPDSTVALADGTGKDAVLTNCTGCHSTDFLSQQPVQPAAVWAAEVAKMRKTYHAPVAEADVNAIVGYLAARKPGP